MEFVAVDVETANPDMASICQIGAVRFANGTVAAEWKALINPGDYFDPINVSIHGIDSAAVVDAPRFPEVFPILNGFIGDRISVCHTHFDRVAVSRAASKHGLEAPPYRWIDTAAVARRTWSQFAQRGYGLANVCEFIGFEFAHHDALEDAKAAGNILVAAIRHTGLDLSSWAKRVREPIAAIEKSEVVQETAMHGPLSGEVIVFTGALQVPRRTATDIALGLGGEVDDGVTRKTTILVVGDQDVARLAGSAKSSKHRKAEARIAAGQRIRILRESDFTEVAKTVG